MKSEEQTTTITIKNHTKITLQNTLSVKSFFMMKKLWATLINSSIEPPLSTLQPPQTTFTFIFIPHYHIPNSTSNKKQSRHNELGKIQRGLSRNKRENSENKAKPWTKTFKTMFTLPKSGNTPKNSSEVTGNFIFAGELTENLIFLDEFWIFQKASSVRFSSFFLAFSSN